MNGHLEGRDAPRVVRAASVARGLAGSLLVVATMALATGCGEKPRPVPPPPPVKVGPVVEQDVPIYNEWVGTLNGFVNAQIRSRVQGYLISQNYVEGSLVKTGDLLFQVDPRPFQNSVDAAAAKLRQAESEVTQAKAQVDAAQAQLAQARATVTQAKADVEKAEALQKKTELNVARYTPLASRGSVSQQELDDATQNNAANLAQVAAAKAGLENAQANVQKAQASLEKARADVETANADVAAAKAALSEAQLNLSYTKVISPIDGVAGFRVANIGDLVGPSEAALLTTVSQVNPIYAQFPIAEQLSLRVLRRWEKDPKAPRTLELELILADGTTFPLKGRAELLDRQVDPTTGTALVKSVFPNPGNVLRPGQYGKVRGITDVKKNALLVPQRAVVDQQGLYLVAVVKPDDTVDLRPVKVGERIGSQWIISEGLKPGERVVVEGVEKVRPGEKVKPVPVS
jgi:membrane fusion protein, multidrug efflux system